MNSRKKPEHVTHRLKIHADNLNVPACLVNLKDGSISYRNALASNNKELQSSLPLNLEDFIKKIDLNGYFQEQSSIEELKWDISGYRVSENHSILCFVKKSGIRKNNATTRVLKTEIRKHRSTQKELDQLKYYSEKIVESSLDMILTVSSAYELMEFNKQAERITGFSRAELYGSDMDAIFVNSDHVKKILGNLTAQIPYEGELTIKNRSLEELTVRACIAVLYDDESQILGFAFSMKDISDVKNWQFKVADIESRYTDLFENATDLIQETDIDGNILMVNRAWSNKMGYDFLECCSLSIYDCIHPKQKVSLKKQYSELLKGNIEETKNWKFLTKKGKFLELEVNSNLTYQSGKVSAVRSIMRDITETTRIQELNQKQDARIQAFFESGAILFWSVNKDIKLTSFNSEYSQMITKLYGKAPQIDLKANTPKENFASLEYHGFWKAKYQDVFKTGNNVSFQTKTTDLSGKIYYREIYLKAINISNGDIKEVAGMGIDITEKKMAERRLNEQASKIQTIFNATNHMIWSLDTDFKFTSFNEVFFQKIKSRWGEEVKVGDDAVLLAEKLNLDLEGIWKDTLPRALAGEKIQFETAVGDINEYTHIEEVALSPIYNDENEVVEIAGVAQTVTYKKTAEIKLKDQAAKINAIFDSTAMLIWSLDQKMRIVSYNKVFADQHYKMLGKDVSIGTDFLRLIAKNVSSIPYKELKKKYRAAFKGKKQQFEGIVKTVAGEKRWLESFINPIYSETDGIKEISCLCYDITEKKVIEEQMRESIHEKEVLLQEVHHRVKNNLQVISSILNLQSSYVKDANSLKILRESQNRIKSMSFIHESLYQTKDFSQIEFGGYILSLAKNLVHSYSLKSESISLKTKFEKTFLTLDQAIPAGLIVNELISNAIKYAFNDENGGEIFCSIKEINGVVHLVIADNGIGLPSGFDFATSHTLGLQLVHTLVEQLDAEIRVDSTDGAKYLVTFAKQ